ncbi:hypothetical protein KCP73_08455 [Salmonella enterica subsp. enterica]|nr:hypothetical protein KCP73_08455 [Salmonella enterica subsp. enterica]
MANLTELIPGITREQVCGRWQTFRPLSAERVVGDAEVIHRIKRRDQPSPETLPDKVGWEFRPEAPFKRMLDEHVLQGWRGAHFDEKGVITRALFSIA